MCAGVGNIFNIPKMPYAGLVEFIRRLENDYHMEKHDLADSDIGLLITECWNPPTADFQSTDKSRSACTWMQPWVAQIILNS